LRAGVPDKHGIDGFRELSAAGLVDAACIDPNVVPSVVLGDFAAVHNLGKTALRTGEEVLSAQLDIFEQDFVVFPRVR
jgi:hypothetical protein